MKAIFKSLSKFAVFKRLGLLGIFTNKQPLTRASYRTLPNGTIRTLPNGTIRHV
jgi:hypothetical protein